MADATHTPKWTVSPDGWEILDGTGRVVLACPRAGSKQSQRDHEDLRMAAAAPALLSVCEAVSAATFAEPMPIAWLPAFNAMHRAIAAARGA